MKRVIFYSSLLLIILTLIVWGISVFIQPILPPTVNTWGIIFFLAFNSVVSAVSGFKDIIELINHFAPNEKVNANANVNEQSSHLDFDEVDFVASPILDYVIPDLDEALSYDDKLEIKEELSIDVILYQNMRLDKTIHIPFHKCEAYVQNDKGNKFDIPQRRWSWKSESPETIKVTERDIQFEGIGSINFRAYIPLESLVGISVKDRIGWLSQEQKILDWVDSEELSITLVLKTIDGQDISMTIPTNGWQDTWYEYMNRD